MTMHLQKDLNNLRKSLLLLGAKVEENINHAIELQSTGDLSIAKRMEEAEDAINEMEVTIEEECLKVLALHQPVATDLRFIIVALKVNNDLERMGDQAINVLERKQFLANFPPVAAELEFAEMGAIVRTMVKSCLDSLVNQEVTLAERVREMDDSVDDIHAQMFKTLRATMESDPAMVAPCLSLLTISSNFERMADLATNIAEEVIFMEGGEVVRHQHEHEYNHQKD
ncbi:MAG: phosphate signaling complex protein PhoU [Pseudomonadales bacterium]|nr:phosphate signaling complex protein PhoU [Pseudomonadales bacterium]